MSNLYLAPHSLQAKREEGVLRGSKATEGRVGGISPFHLFTLYYRDAAVVVADALTLQVVGV